MVLFLPISQALVLERHALQLMLCFGSGRKLRLLTAQQFEPAVGEIGNRLIHHHAIAAGGGAHLPMISGFESRPHVGTALASCGPRTCRDADYPRVSGAPP